MNWNRFAEPSKMPLKRGESSLFALCFSLAEILGRKVEFCLPDLLSVNFDSLSLH
jgi:hypothetical protein